MTEWSRASLSGVPVRDISAASDDAGLRSLASGGIVRSAAPGAKLPSGPGLRGDAIAVVVAISDEGCGGRPWPRPVAGRRRLRSMRHVGRQVAVPGEGPGQGGGVDGPGRGFLVGRRGASEPERAEFPGHLGADLGAFLLWQGAVDVAGGLGTGLSVGSGRAGGCVESGEAAGGEDGFGGVPVRPPGWGPDSAWGPRIWVGSSVVTLNCSR